MRASAIVLVLTLSLSVTAQELNPSNLKKGDAGPLPSTSTTRKYAVASVSGEDLVVVSFLLQGKLWKLTDRFIYRDPEAVEKYGKLPQKGAAPLDAPILLPDTYTVIGTKITGKKSVPVLVKRVN